LEAAAQYMIREGGEEGTLKSRTLIVPYAFSTETLGFGVGVGASYGPKSESLYYSTVYVTDNGSDFFMIGGNNLRLFGKERFHFSPKLMLGHFTHMRIYVDGNPGFVGERAGSNESSAGNYREENANDIVVDLEFRYTLPWGHYRDHAVHTYITDNGILKENPSGAASMNPLESGQSALLFRPYYRKQYTDVEGMETLYFQLGYKHDNRDFILNPHRGYLVKTGISHDPDWLADTRKWTSLEGEIDGFIPLWDTSWSRQQTLALAAWAAYSPTYDSSTENDGKPPYFTGPNLGGFWRMRGYPSSRFHDKAAIYYSAEYRLMPEWQPFGKIGLLDPLKIRWWQIVGLVEAGRVAPSWDLGTLHTDMKYDVGIGLRGMFHASVGRIDFVVSDEGFAFSAMLGQTF
ncbi:MAG: BamA/TamA family outer membrane protein, partial [Verrucomicrobia bacterium]|nr:BamA/TamA family outer membrane protein [Verrucomicrobiota bacterium]